MRLFYFSWPPFEALGSCSSALKLNSIKNLWSGVYKNIPHCNERRERKQALVNVLELWIYQSIMSASSDKTESDTHTFSYIHSIFRRNVNYSKASFYAIIVSQKNIA